MRNGIEVGCRISVSGGGSGVKERVKIMEKDLVGEKRKPWMVAQEEVVEMAD